MSEPSTAAQGTQNKPNPQIGLQKIYLKDASFESPRAPAIFKQAGWQPEVNLQINTETHALEDNAFEVVLTLTATANHEKEALYLVEVKQAGIFTLQGFEQQQLQAVLSTFCPTNLFPYAREAISSLVERGGFPQLLLQPINFDALYQQHLQKLQATEKADTDVAH